MDYFTRLRRDHDLLERMLYSFKELILRLGKAKAVNLVHLEKINQVWRDYLCREHLNREEEGFFPILDRMGHPLLAEMVEAHEILVTQVSKLEDIVRRLRAGRANSGRELVKLGEEFTWRLEKHLREEKLVFAEVENESEERKERDGDLDLGFSLDSPPVGERRIRLDKIVQIVEEISAEYFGKSINLDWLTGNVEKELKKEEEEKEAEKGDEKKAENKEEKESPMATETGNKAKLQEEATKMDEESQSAEISGNPASEAGEFSEGNDISPVQSGETLMKDKRGCFGEELK